MDRTRVDVLIVEDYADSRELLGLTLRRRGFSVALAGSGEEALCALEQVVPTLVFLDLRLADTGARSLARAIRRAVPHAKVSIIALTGLQGECQAELGDDFDGLLHKPIAPALLLQVARRVLDGLTACGPAGD